MVSDVLEIALKARSYALGPLHPSFSIVDILKNGLRRLVKLNAFFQKLFSFDNFGIMVIKNITHRRA